MPWILCMDHHLLNPLPLVNMLWSFGRTLRPHTKELVNTWITNLTGRKRFMTGEYMGSPFNQENWYGFTVLQYLEVSTENYTDHGWDHIELSTNFLMSPIVSKVCEHADSKLSYTSTDWSCAPWHAYTWGNTQVPSEGWPQVFSRRCPTFLATQ